MERTWYLVAYNDRRSSPGVQEAFTLFNPNGTLIGYTGCKDLSANYQTNYNQITITGINLGPGTCPDATLQEQEGAMVAILRAARSYTIADTVLQIAGDAGFLSYSLTPLDRPAGVTPPQAAIQVVPQAQVGQVVVFDGSASSGQAPLVAWNWDFGDGATASGVVVQHTYTTAGTFTVQPHRDRSAQSNRDHHHAAAHPGITHADSHANRSAAHGNTSAAHAATAAAHLHAGADGGTAHRHARAAARSCPAGRQHQRSGTGLHRRAGAASTLPPRSRAAARSPLIAGAWAMASIYPPLRNRASLRPTIAPEAMRSRSLSTMPKD